MALGWVLAFGAFTLYNDDSKIEQGVIQKASNCTSTYEAELYGNLDAINHSINVMEENILLPTGSKCSVQAIQKLSPKIQKKNTEGK